MIPNPNSSAYPKRPDFTPLGESDVIVGHAHSEQRDDFFFPLRGVNNRNQVVSASSPAQSEGTITVQAEMIGVAPFFRQPYEMLIAVSTENYQWLERTGFSCPIRFTSRTIPGQSYSPIHYGAVNMNAEQVKGLNEAAVVHSLDYVDALMRSEALTDRMREIVNLFTTNTRLKEVFANNRHHEFPVWKAALNKCLYGVDLISLRRKQEAETFIREHGWNSFF